MGNRWVKNTVLLASVQVWAASVSAQIADTAAADSLYDSGDFTPAAESYAALSQSLPENIQIRRRRGELALLRNDLTAAEHMLREVLARDAADKKARELLAETLYRSKDFPRAAPLFRELGRAAMAEKLAAIGDNTPYEIIEQRKRVVVPFVLTDPLPLLKVKVNQSPDVYFLIDTGAAEIILDPVFAESVQARRFGAEERTFAGGKSAAYEHGLVDSVTVGDVVVRNVPVHILDTRRFAAAAGGKRVDGIVGTVFLYQFLSTIDYPKGQLVLSPRVPVTGEVTARNKSESTTEIPFWLAGDHFMVAMGAVQDAPPALMLVDTGMAGGGFTCPESTLKAAGITLSGTALEGQGGGGKVSVTPFTADRLRLGGVTRENIVSFFGAFPSPLERSLGFRVGGLVSHGFFRPFAVTFDFDGMKLRLTKS